MDEIYDEQGKVKVEERLKDEFQDRSDSSDSLRKSTIDPQNKINQSKLEIEKLAQELSAKSEEINDLRQMYEELQSSMLRKDAFLQQISSVNGGLLGEHSEKILNLESENRYLVVGLSEASIRIRDLEKKTCASDAEIDSLKMLLSIKSENFLEAQKDASKDLREKDEYLTKMEEKSRTFQNQLKWRNEQFSHLEEAHAKLQVQLQASIAERQKDKASLTDEVSLLQSALDSQVRISESLEKELKFCKQVLVHEKSKRKSVETELAESRTQLENVFIDFHTTRSKPEQFTMRENEDATELCELLSTKDALGNDMACRIAQLEEENYKLKESLKIVQPVQPSNDARSLKKMQTKLKGLEQLHGQCARNLKVKETEWNSEIEKLNAALNCCLSELDVKNKITGELLKELEEFQFLLDAKNEEIILLFMFMQSEFCSAYSKMHDEKEKLGACMNQVEEESMLLKQQLELNNTELQKVHVELKQRCDEIAVLVDGVGSLDSSMQHYSLIKVEIKTHKEMIDASSECQHGLKEQCLELENALKENVKNALEIANSELAGKFSKASDSKLALQQWKSEAETLKLKLEENQLVHSHKSAGILAILKDQYDKIGMFQKQVCMLKLLIEEKSEAADILKQERDSCLQIADATNNSIGRFHRKIALLEDELIEREEKMGLLREALMTAEDQKIVEVEAKNQIILSLEKEMKDLMKEAEFQEKELIQSKQDALQLEVSLQTGKLEMLELKGQFEKERSHFHDLLKEFKKSPICHSVSLAKLEDIGERFEAFCMHDAELMDMLGKISSLTEYDSNASKSLLATAGVQCTTFSPTRKPFRVNIDEERHPLTEINTRRAFT